MVRQMMAIAAGYFSIVFLNGLIHVILSVYFNTDLSLAGISHLPSLSWTVLFTALQLLFGLFGGLLTATIAQNNQHIAILGFILLMVIISLINYSVLSMQEPLWYLITSPSLKIIGILAGYQLIQAQNKTHSTSAQ